MQTSVVNYKDLNFESRIDAEYYRAEILNNISLLDKKDNAVLNDLASFVIGPFGSTVTVDQYVPLSKFKYIRNKDINDFQISDNEPAYIPEQVYSALPQFHIKENDLLITVVGTLGKVAIATKKDVSSIFSCKSTIIRAQKIDPFYLLVYLNSKVGQLFALRGVRGAIQQGLNLSDLKEIRVFLPSEKFQKAISDTVLNAFYFTEEARNLYAQTERLLLTELDLLNWQPKHRLAFVKTCSDTEQAGRIDAEYFQPKYDEIIRLSKANSLYTKTISEIRVKNTRGLQPKYVENGELDVVTSKHILEDGLAYNCFEKTHKENWDVQKKARIKKGDILTYTTGANIGRTAVYSSDNPALASNHVNILSIKNEDPKYVGFVMNSLIGRLQTERLSAGSAQVELYPKDIDLFIIPFISKKKQEKIMDNIAKSHEYKLQSKHLLECAKRAVEIAIEQNEDKAIKWLNKQTENMRE